MSSHESGSLNSSLVPMGTRRESKTYPNKITATTINFISEHQVHSRIRYANVWRELKNWRTVCYI